MAACITRAVTTLALGILSALLCAGCQDPPLASNATNRAMTSQQSATIAAHKQKEEQLQGENSATAPNQTTDEHSGGPAQTAAPSMNSAMSAQQAAAIASHKNRE